MPNFPEVMGAIDAGGWYGDRYGDGKMEKLVAWALLSNGRIIPLFVGDRVAVSFQSMKFYHPHQFEEPETEIAAIVADET